MPTAQIGIYGLGTMGSALALNLAGHGITVAVANREADWIAPFLQRAGSLAANLTGADTVENFIAALARPRVVLFMIPSGAPLDKVIAKIAPLLAPGDTIIDAGNADFNDTNRRAASLSDAGLHYVGLGVSGGAAGARHGPSMMFGGSAQSWSRLRPIFETIAAHYQGDPCVARVGPDGAGHFVKTVHNGIEYADMQMIAEVYGLLRDGADWSAGRIATLFSDWSRGPLHSYLIEITALVLSVSDSETGHPMVDVIADVAGQKGTGRWTVIEALKLGQSASTIEAAVGARAWSAQKDLREMAAPLLPAGAGASDLPTPEELEHALLAGRIIALMQGFEVLAAASREFDWALDLARIAEIWRAGCIIRSELLNDFTVALRADPPLLLADPLRAMLGDNISALRTVVTAALGIGLAVPALSAGLAWYDSIRHARGTANLIQAQRDVFGAHGFGRIDRPGQHHGNWPEK
ncbi:NADP-dependent phosphogluconate dehydrogenase [Pontibaca salina]|uniref:6-phosphogluconate dehydrogenase, decarboxylating n=1 Tax=Pontibaca salina TaxID=2795731 RepID=A0A934M3S5_9RHOB|nr:NADP-dependent phosphogluconate dehydrogenase [Pontibaca salina]MBI6630164.1 NADP-dependent phosphogluconate dehydrogenase [Pontibaca salina]